MQKSYDQINPPHQFPYKNSRLLVWHVACSSMANDEEYAHHAFYQDGFSATCKPYGVQAPVIKLDICSVDGMGLPSFATR